MKHDAFRLGPRERVIVEAAIKEVCSVRDYILFGHNVRIEHVHVVVSNSALPERMMNSFKSYATRALRAAGLLGSESKAWSRHGSTRYLWTEDHVAIAIDYVVNWQGGELRRFD
jgi:REP element-mobilizing transposase RayT